jgi:hypothetical protein
MIKFGKILAFLTCIIYIFIFLAFYFTTNITVLLCGYYFTVLAFFINLASIGIILSLADRGQKEVKRTIFIMLLNIPVAMLYFYFIIAIVKSLV